MLRKLGKDNLFQNSQFHIVFPQKPPETTEIAQNGGISAIAVVEGCNGVRRRLDEPKEAIPP